MYDCDFLYKFSYHIIITLLNLLIKYILINGRILLEKALQIYKVFKVLNNVLSQDYYFTYNSSVCFNCHLVNFNNLFREEYLCMKDVT